MNFCSFDNQYTKSIYDIEKEIFNDCYSVSTLNVVSDDSHYKYSLILTDNYDVIAYIIVYEVAGEAEIHRIAVASDYRGKGYGNMILNKCIESLKSDKIGKLHLEVRKSNYVAISLYEKFGFEPVGIRKNYYSDNNDDALLYTLCLVGR